MLRLVLTQIVLSDGFSRPSQLIDQLSLFATDIAPKLLIGALEQVCSVCLLLSDLILVV